MLHYMCSVYYIVYKILSRPYNGGIFLPFFWLLICESIHCYKMWCTRLQLSGLDRVNRSQIAQKYFVFLWSKWNTVS